MTCLLYNDDCILCISISSKPSQLELHNTSNAPLQGYKTLHVSPDTKRYLIEGILS